MKAFLLDLNKLVNEAGGMLPPNEANIQIEKYHQLLNEKADIKCPPPDDTQRPKGT